MGTHQDDFAEETQYSQQEPISVFESFNSEAVGDISISTPTGRREVELQKPLLVALARENWSKASQKWSDQDGSVDAIFDEALCEVTERALQTVAVPDEQGALYKLRALMIQIARDINGYEDLAEYIAQYSAADLEQFGLRGVREKSTYRKAAKSLKREGKFQTMRDACFVAVHALFWNGVPVPESVKDRYRLDYDAGPAASDFSDGARRLALYNLVEDVIQIVEENLSLHRGENASREIRSLLGVFAYAARHDESIEYYTQTAQHTFDLSTVFAGSTIRTHLESLEIWKIDDMFDDANQALLKYVLESGILDEPAVVSYDLTDIQSLETETDEIPFLTEDGRWRFASLSFTDSDLDFSFGLRLLKSEAQRARILKNFLRDLIGTVDVDLFMADRGFDGREDIDACRKFLRGRWVICAQDDSKQVGRSSDYAQLRAALQPGGTAVKRSAGYAELTPPVKLIGYADPRSETDTPDRILAFYTDKEFSDEKQDRTDEIMEIVDKYNKRAKIESIFRMAKNRFDIATDSSKPQVKAFYFQMSVLLHNLYKIVNEVPSPKAGIELSTSQNEFLEITHNLALGGPTTPDALTYHRHQQ